MNVILFKFLFLIISYFQDENSGLYTGDGSVDIKGNPVLKSETGNWRACPFILGTSDSDFAFLTLFYIVSDLLADLGVR